MINSKIKTKLEDMFLTHCSFCEKPRDDTLLMIGPQVSICTECALMAVQQFVLAGTNRMLTVACGRPPDPNGSWSDLVDKDDEEKT